MLKFEGIHDAGLNKEQFIEICCIAYRTRIWSDWQFRVILEKGIDEAVEIGKTIQRSKELIDKLIPDNGSPAHE